MQRIGNLSSSHRHLIWQRHVQWGALLKIKLLAAPDEGKGSNQPYGTADSAADEQACV